MRARTVDLNCDVGESFGAWTIGRDAEVLPHVTSANIACGFHAGDPGVMRRTLQLAIEHGVAIGAHPGFPDLQGFGRRAMHVTPQELYDMVAYQVGALHAIARTLDASIAHVKPHGAMYNMAAASEELADAVARAVRGFDASLVLFGLAGSELVRAGERHGVRAIGEAFPDRGYAADGTLLPRSQPGALITDPGEMARRAVKLADDGAGTLCIHGDGPDAPELAKRAREALERAGYEVKAP